MEVILKQDVDALGLRGEVVNVARGYARNFLLPRGLAESATPGLVRELEKRDALRARHEAKTVDEARAIASTARGARASVRRQRRPDRLAVRLGHRDERRRPALGAGEDPRRPPEALDGHDQADRPLHGAGRGLRRRRRRAEARRRPGGPGAADRGGARSARGRGAGAEAAAPRPRRRGRGRRGAVEAADDERPRPRRRTRAEASDELEAEPPSPTRAGRPRSPQALHRPVDNFPPLFHKRSTACGTRCGKCRKERPFVHCR